MTGVGIIGTLLLPAHPLMAQSVTMQATPGR